MADPEFYQDPDEVKRVNQIYQKLTTELEDYYQQWEQLVDTIQIKDDE